MNEENLHESIVPYPYAEISNPENTSIRLPLKSTLTRTLSEEVIVNLKCHNTFRYDVKKLAPD